MMVVPLSFVIYDPRLYVVLTCVLLPFIYLAATGVLSDFMNLGLTDTCLGFSIDTDTWPLAMR